MICAPWTYGGEYMQGPRSILVYQEYGPHPMVLSTDTLRPGNRISTKLWNRGKKWTSRATPICHSSQYCKNWPVHIWSFDIQLEKCRNILNNITYIYFTWFYFTVFTFSSVLLLVTPWWFFTVKNIKEKQRTVFFLLTETIFKKMLKEDIGNF